MQNLRIKKYEKFQAGFSGRVSQVIRDGSFCCHELLRQYTKAASLLLDIINAGGNFLL